MKNLAMTFDRALAIVAALAFLGLLDGEAVRAQEEAPPVQPGLERQLPAPEAAPRSGAEAEALTEAISSKLRCPVCQGLSVADSPSESALNMKAEVRELVEKGYSADQILAYFEGTYGEFVRLEPKARGLNLLVWLLPVAAVLVGLALVLRTGRRGATSPAPDDELERYREQVRREIGP
jgi:cytochrome c-type biogenesis protein CcmH